MDRSCALERLERINATLHQRLTCAHEWLQDMSVTTSENILAGLAVRVGMSGGGNSGMYGHVLATSGVYLKLAGEEPIRMQSSTRLPGAVHLYDLLGQQVMVSPGQHYVP